MIPGALVEDDSSWIEWNRIADFYDDHPYGNNHTWVQTLQGLNEYILAHGLKPLVLGESISADTWPDYTSIVKAFGPVPLRQTQPIKHNKKNSAELWVVFLLREHFRSLGLGKDRYWPLVAPLCTAAGILNQNGQAFSPDELKSWWQKNWPRTYTQLEQKQDAADSGGAAYEQDFGWFQAWIGWQRAR